MMLKQSGLRSSHRLQPQSRARTVQCRAAAQKPVKLIYFSAPGRAEAARLMLTVGMVDFEDVRITREEWPAIKATAPYGQLPMLEVHGRQLAQSNAIDRYVAKLTGHYPNESWDQARVDSIVSFTEEFFQQFTPVFSIKDPEERLAAVQGVVDGPLGTRLERLDKMLGALAPNAFMVGNKLTWADMAVFSITCSLISGFIQGVPADLYEKKYPNIEKFRTRVASIPSIKAYFERAQHITDPTRQSFRAAPVTVNA